MAVFSFSCCLMIAIRKPFMWEKKNNQHTEMRLHIFHLKFIAGVFRRKFQQPNEFFISGNLWASKTNIRYRRTCSPFHNKRLAQWKRRLNKKKERQCLFCRLIYNQEWVIESNNGSSTGQKVIASVLYQMIREIYTM